MTQVEVLYVFVVRNLDIKYLSQKVVKDLVRVIRVSSDVVEPNALKLE